MSIVLQAKDWALRCGLLVGNNSEIEAVIRRPHLLNVQRLTSFMSGARWTATRMRLVNRDKYEELHAEGEALSRKLTLAPEELPAEPAPSSDVVAVNGRALGPGALTPAEAP